MSPYLAMCLSFEFAGLAVAILYAQGQYTEAFLLLVSWS